MEALLGSYQERFVLNGRDCGDTLCASCPAFIFSRGSVSGFQATSFVIGCRMYTTFLLVDVILNIMQSNQTQKPHQILNRHVVSTVVHLDYSSGLIDDMVVGFGYYMLHAPCQQLESVLLKYCSFIISIISSSYFKAQSYQFPRGNPIVSYFFQV